MTSTDTTNGVAHLADRHAIVTGGGSGIGAAIASELARLGARLTLMGRTEERLERQSRHLRNEYGADTAAVRCDVSNDGSVAEAFTAARDRFGEPYVLVNNAGQAEAALLRDTTRELWDGLLAVNLTGVYLCTREVLPAMTEARGGRIINVASTAGLRGHVRGAAYCASKHGVIGFTRAVAAESARYGVTINAVCPSYTDTEMTDSAVDNLVHALDKTPGEARTMLTRIIPRGTLIRPEEVASLVGWLCAPDAAAMTGAAIPMGEVI